jgi:predicted nucleic acid-binding protein
VIRPTHDRLAVVDTSGWLEYVTDGPNADFFAPAIEARHRLVVPTISIHEVFKWILRERGEDAAFETVALMQQGRVVDMDVAFAIVSARLGRDHRLPLADSVMLATARASNAVLWTQDADFEGLDDVAYCPKRRNPPP